MLYNKPLTVLTGKPGGPKIVQGTWDKSIMRKKETKTPRPADCPHAAEPGAHPDQALLEANMRLSEALTELKRHQQQIIQQARLNALGQMTSGITHDFNNALMPIQGFSEFLLNNPDMLDNKQDTLNILKDIHAAARHASDMIRRLSNFYRPSEETERIPVNIEEIVKDVVSITRPRWKEEMGARDVQIKFKIDFRSSPALCCNETQVREAFTNLVMNAIDALPQGGTISIDGQTDSKWFMITIADNGVGMAPEVRQRCFEPFFSTKGKDGTGIGLAMVYGIVRSHDGHIEVASEEGAGTSFAIRLPTDIAPYAKSRSQSPRQQEPENLHILIVDDEPWSRNFMTRHLRHSGHRVVATGNGEEGLEKFQQTKFDVVITDRAMPDMSGDSVAQRMKAICPDTPIVMVTGFGEIMKATGEMPSGVDEVLGKPITRTELSDAIARAVGAFDPVPSGA